MTNTDLAKQHLQKALERIENAVNSFSDSLSFDKLHALEYIPEEILKLPHLKNLTCRQCRSLKEIDVILELTELETLIFDDINSEYETFLPQLSRLKNLKVLHIDSFDFESEILMDELISLKYLEDFSVYASAYNPTWSLSLDAEYEKKCEELLKNYKFPQNFKKLSKLKSFSFKLCDFDIDDVLIVLMDMPNLRKLRISAHGQPTLLSKMTQLEELDLSHWEDLEKLPEDIGNLQNLKSLDLSCDVDYMILDELPDSFYTLKNLEKLYLYGCKNITHFKDEFKYLKSLHTIHTVGSSIYSVPFSKEQLGNLVDIAIQGELPNFSLCSKLKKLYYYKSGVGWNIVKGNYGTEEDFDMDSSNVETLISLESLRIMGGKLLNTSFLAKLINLKKLVLICDVANLAEDIGKLKMLEEIRLERISSINTLPESFCELQSLQRLEIEESKIEEVPACLNNLTSLKDFRLNGEKKLKNIEEYRHG